VSVGRTFRSDGGLQAALNWSSGRASAASLVVEVTTQDNFVLFGASAGGLANRCTPAVTGRTSNRDQRLLRLRAAAAGPRLRRDAEAPTAPTPAATVEPVAEAPEVLVALEETEAAPPAPEAPAPKPTLAVVEPVAEPDEADPSQLDKYTLNIEALENYELLRPIPVSIEALGERVFVAEVAELNLSISGQTAEDAVHLLKELMVRMYEGNRSKRSTLDTERRRQQRTLETYIGRAKGTWPWT
jgi:hypothetical protein